MVKDKPIKFSKDDQDTLQHLSDLLHLFHHRNKNQHRRSTWWRHFSVFRRQLNLLLNDIKEWSEVPRTHLGRIRITARDRHTQIRIRERLDFWRDILVSKWQSSFSQIIADGRFAVLGLVLLAVLAQVCQITGITVALDDLGQIEVQKVITKFGEEAWQADLEHEADRKQRDEDVGVAITRDEDVLEGEKVNSTDVRTSGGVAKMRGKRKIPASKPDQKPAKRKKKKGDAIDDLFGGLD